MAFSGKRFAEGLRGRRLSALASVALLALLATAVYARQDKAQLRTVHGTIFNSSEQPIGSAIVYLKNVRTLAIRTYIADRNGQYRFSGLDPNTDYQIHAEHEDLTSNTRTISSYDSRHDILLDLKVNRKKSDK
ncbi:MAG: carboxypeptidase regulatory-like domain-containing protein [Acidobacteriota bacterium]|nr:carboxypeptidase regulatory-like domain-containing protein [Acidobacteriota bacterium]